jgi:short subunit dehydrogenase-like uncharacterized protein
MTRIVVLGGRGFFGRAAVGLLRGFGLSPLTGGRSRGADVVVDADDAASVRRSLRAGDVMLDAAGPFQRRTPALVDAAIELGFDVVDIGDSLAYAQAVMSRSERIAEAGITVCPSASTVSAVSAALVRLSGIAEPVRASCFLVPAARHSAVDASSASLLSSVGRSVTVWDDGRLVERRGWTTTRRIADLPPFGALTGHLFETADALFLPMAFPSLRSAATLVDTRVPGLNAALSAAARVPPLLALVRRTRRLALPIARRFGRVDGGFGVEVQDAAGGTARVALASSGPGFLTAVAPAALACRALAEGRFPHRGLVPPHLAAPADDVVALLARHGIHLVRG